MRTQKGFAHVGILLSIVVIAAVAFGGWYVWHHNKDKNNTPVATASAPTTETTPAPTPEITLDKTYKDTVGLFKFKYPSDWKVKTTVSQEVPKSSLSTLTSPSGTKLLTYAWAGGGFGFCEGDSCGDLMFKSYEDIGKKSLQISEDSNGFVYKKVPIYLVTLSETSKLGKTSYYIGLTTDRTAKTKVGKVQKGVATESFGNFLIIKDNNKKSSYPMIAIYASSTKKSFLSGDDAKTIEAMLKSFEYTE